MTHRLTVTVVDTAGQPVANVRVVVSVLAPAGNPAALVADAGVVRGQAREVTSNASGVVTFDLLPLEQLYMLVMKGYPADNAPIWFRMPPHDATLGEAVRATPITGGGGTTEPLLFGTSVDDVPDPAELIIVGTTVSGTIPAYTGGLHWLIARRASEPFITSVVALNDPTGQNQIGAFTRYPDTVIPAGKTEAYNVWVSNQDDLTAPTDTTLEVS